jgi:hypothetical protein
MTTTVAERFVPTTEDLKTAVTLQTIAEGSGLHVDLGSDGCIRLVLWGMTFNEDVTIFKKKLTPEQEHLIRNADKVDAWKVEPELIRSFEQYGC